MKIKSSFTGILLCLSAITVSAADTNSLAIIPWPQKATLEAGVFKLTPDTSVFGDSASRQTADFLTERLRQSTGYPFKTRTEISSQPGRQRRHSADDQRCQHEFGCGRLRTDRHAGFGCHSRADPGGFVLRRANLVAIVAAGNFLLQRDAQRELADAVRSN